MQLFRPKLPIFTTFEQTGCERYVPPFPDSDSSAVSNVFDPATATSRMMGDLDSKMVAMRPDVTDQPLESLRGMGLAESVDQFPALVNAFSGPISDKGFTFNASSRFGKDRSTYILYARSRPMFVLDTRRAHMVANFNALASLVLAEPRVVVGDHCALWGYVGGDHPRDGELWGWMSGDDPNDQKFARDFVAATLVYNLWQDRHSLNYIRRTEGHLTLIDFYSKATNECDRFTQSFPDTR